MHKFDFISTKYHDLFYKRQKDIYKNDKMETLCNVLSFLMWANAENVTTYVCIRRSWVIANNCHGNNFYSYPF